MDISGVHHIVLLVDDVPDGEALYRELCDMEQLFREGTLDGNPGTLPPGIDWEEAISKGVSPYMSFLGRDSFFLAVAETDQPKGDGRLDHIALDVDNEMFEAVTDRAEQLGYSVKRNAPYHRVFEDELGVEWELNTNSRPPSQAFEILDL
jgi:catechol 2,3-dioxygenase-like lactoylglutathione lyase family enzyme